VDSLRTNALFQLLDQVTNVYCRACHVNSWVQMKTAKPPRA